MKKIARSGRFFAWSAPRKLALLPAVALLFVGCQRKPTDEPQQTPAAPSAVAERQSAATPEPSHTSVASVETTPPAAAARPSGSIEFVDVTEQAGIHFKHNSGAFGKKYLPETMGSGVCFIDYDNDGWQDIFFVNSMDWPEHKSGKSYSALYHNNHDGTFTDVTREAGLAIESYGLGCAVGDYDNDGYQDLYVTTVGSNHLFHNLGNGISQTLPRKPGSPVRAFPPARSGSITTTTASLTCS
jgi:enediyne biosynthesis protein E4